MDFKKSQEELIESDEVIKAKELLAQEETKNYEAAQKEFNEFMEYFTNKYKIGIQVTQPQIQFVKL